MLRLVRTSCSGLLGPLRRGGIPSAGLLGRIGITSSIQPPSNPPKSDDLISKLNYLIENMATKADVTNIVGKIGKDLSKIRKDVGRIDNMVGGLMEKSLRVDVAARHGYAWGQTKILKALPDLLQYPSSVREISEAHRMQWLAGLLSRVESNLIPFAEALQNHLNGELGKAAAKNPDGFTAGSVNLRFVKDNAFSSDIASSFDLVTKYACHLPNKADIALMHRLRWYYTNRQQMGVSELFTSAEGPGLAIYAWTVDKEWFRIEVEIDCSGKIVVVPISTAGGVEVHQYSVEMGEIKTSSSARGDATSQLSRRLCLVKQVLQDTLNAKHLALCGYVYYYQNCDPEDKVEVQDDRHGTAVSIKFVRLGPQSRNPRSQVLDDGEV